MATFTRSTRSLRLDPLLVLPLLLVGLAPASGSAAGLSTGPIWTAESNQVGARFGASVATAGDVNLDGYSDIIVGAHRYDSGQTDEGLAFIYLGGPSGISGSFVWSAEGNQATAQFGASVATAGDVEGDGYRDILVGAPGWNNGTAAVGRVYLYRVTSGGIAMSPVWTKAGTSAGGLYGRSVSTAGDVNGDGYEDVIIGAPLHTNGQSLEGRAEVYYGSPSGLSSTPDWSSEGNQDGAAFGTSVAPAGDVNADGYADVIVGAPNFDNGEADEGRALLFLGSATGPSSSSAWDVESNQAGAQFGISVMTAGDVNGDGYSDVIVGANGYDALGYTNNGRAFLYLGSALGLSGTPAQTLDISQAHASFGYSVSTAGDVNGDGYADVVVGAYLHDNGSPDEGRAYLYLGWANGLWAPESWTAEGNQTSANFGFSTAPAGDVNGDGLSDVLVGVYGYTNGQSNEGRACVYHGQVSLPSQYPATVANLQSNSRFGEAVASAGDVNADGFSDIVVGAMDYTTGGFLRGAAYLYEGSDSGIDEAADWEAIGEEAYEKLGAAVSGAGDVNGDGYSDVIVGAPFADSGPNADLGRADVYMGSASGLAAAPAWSRLGTQVDARFGAAVAGAGDVNGDGYGDVIVGAFFQGGNAEGRAFIYHGSDSGLMTTPQWSVLGDQPSAWFGRAVQTAGDVNGDGYSDVVVGALYYDNGQSDEGRAYVFNGSASGAATVPSWTGEGNQAIARYGQAVASAGDVNGDGFADLIIGAPYYDNGQADEGRAFVYLGSQEGLLALPVWTAESNEAGALFGSAVAGIGDVNADGFGDILVGAPNSTNGQSLEGRVFLYTGSATGPSLNPTWIEEGNQISARFGTSVAPAGDVNGDGLADPLVGAPFLDFYTPDAGAARVNLAGQLLISPRVAAQPRQMRLFGSGDEPVDLLGVGDSPGFIRLGLRCRSAAGRARVRATWFVGALGSANAAITPGPWQDSGVPTAAGSGVYVDEEISGLTPLTPYHWRARCETDSPFFPRSRWITFRGTGPTLTHFRTGVYAVGVPHADPGSPLNQVALIPASPNPFRRETRLGFDLASESAVTLEILDVSGRRVMRLVDERRPAGRQEAVWSGLNENGRRVSSGVYFARLVGGGATRTQKLILAR